MKLIVEVDEELYNAVKGCDYDFENESLTAIANGTPYNPTGDSINREALKKELNSRPFPQDYSTTLLLGVFNELIDNAPTVEIPVARWDCYCEGQKVGYEKALSERPKGEWYDFIPNCLKARHGEYVLYKVDFLLDNLAREVNIMESARRMKGGAE